ncbi:MAG TPA: hypothetical protein VMC61_02975 [Methanocella sp.]|nr:hypothetical protein [Methanocella sp.]
MRVKRLWTDDSGVNMILEYVFTFTIASILFSVLLMIANGLFIQGPENTVQIIQYTDVGNDVTAKIVDTYLVAPISPDKGNVSTVFEIPNTIAGDGYFVDVKTSANGWDKEVVVHSISNNTARKVTLNGVHSTIPVSGSTWSQFPVHRIWYDSTPINNP